MLTLALIGGVAYASGGAAPAATTESQREIVVLVEASYLPAEITIKEGERVKLVFVRKSWSGCTREVVFPKLDLRRVLPPNERTVVELPALAPGDYDFHCGMNMIHGNIHVQAR